MGHSNIIELSKTRLNIEDRVSEDYFYDGFQGWIAEYVDGDVDEDLRAAEIASFIDGLVTEFPGLVTTDGISITFKEGFNEAFCKKRIAKIKDVVKKSDDEDLLQLTWKVRSLTGDTFGNYIYRTDAGTFTEAAFLRDVIPGTYYFGAVLDYKY